jgi:NADH-quinone oxidoreductase subunit A
MEFVQLGYAGFFFLFGILFVAGGLIANWLLRPSKPTKAKEMPYECGEIPIGSAWMQFHVGYYLIALVFVLFEVEVAFLFPWAAVYKTLSRAEVFHSLYAVGLFIGVLALADAYAWKKGALEWL